mgnify:CR=1 FL=1
MNHRLLILGTLGEFVQLVQKAKQRGLSVMAIRKEKRGHMLMHRMFCR